MNGKGRKVLTRTSVRVRSLLLSSIYTFVGDQDRKYPYIRPEPVLDNSGLPQKG